LAGHLSSETLSGALSPGLHRAQPFASGMQQVWCSDRPRAPRASARQNCSRSRRADASGALGGCSISMYATLRVIGQGLHHVPAAAAARSPRRGTHLRGAGWVIHGV
jgi:hypothetical protein